MPPWNQMTPQQQAMLLQMMRTQFGGGQLSGMPAMQPGMPQPTMAQQMMQPGQAPIGANPMQAQMANPLLNSQGQQNIMQNPQMLQYLLAMHGAASPGLNQFTQYPGW